MLKAKLVVVGGDAKQAEIDLNLPTVIGRGREANLTVPHALVSRRHTEIFEHDDRLYVRDLGSLNGTFINNQRIETDQPLEPNQLLTLGNITFRAVYEIGDHVQAQSETAAIKFENVETVAETMAHDPYSGETVPVDTLTDPVEPDLGNPGPDQKATVYDRNRSQAAESVASANGLVGNPGLTAPVSNGHPHETGTAAVTDSVNVELDSENPDDSVSGSFLKNLPR